MERERADRRAARIEERDGRRRAAVVAWRQVEVDRGPIARVDAVITLRLRWAAVCVGKPRRFRRVKLRWRDGMRRLPRELLEQREVVHDPKGAAVSRRNELALARVDSEVAHLHAGQVQRQRRPLHAAVETDVHGTARAGEEQARLARILPYGK